MPKNTRVASDNSAFREYSRAEGLMADGGGHNVNSCAAPPQKLRRRRPTCTERLTVGLLSTYRSANTEFVYVGAIQNPRHVLTKDARPEGNHGKDNKACDLIITVGDVLGGAHGGHRFCVLGMLGQGTFGQVVKCRAEWIQERNSSPMSVLSSDDDQFPPNTSPSMQKVPTSEMVAVKIVKNKPAYYTQAKVEIKVLKQVTEEFGEGTDPKDPSHSLVRLLYDFEYHHHLCMVFELMSMNLYELIKHQEFRGLEFSRVRAFCAQVLEALSCLYQMQVIHCDVKPENILLENFGDPIMPRIKLIDLGSACYHDREAFTYIQSRFYRAPEVLLHLKYSAPIDLWSAGCVALELFMGLPVFPGVSVHNQLTRIVEMLGLPPDWMIEKGKKGENFFVREPGVRQDHYSLSSFERTMNGSSHPWRLKTPQEWARENRIRNGPEETKRYVKERTLQGIVEKCETQRRPRSEPVVAIPIQDLKCFIDFCSGLLRHDPNKRWTAAQALKHPFITHEQYTKPYVPAVSTEPIFEEELMYTTPVANRKQQNPMEGNEMDVEEDDEPSSRRVTTAPMAVSRHRSNKHAQREPKLSSSLSISRSVDKNLGLSSSQPNRFKRPFDATGASPNDSFSSVGSPITRPNVPYPIAHQSRWSDFSSLVSPQFGVSVTHPQTDPLSQLGTSLPNHNHSLCSQTQHSAYGSMEASNKASSASLSGMSSSFNSRPMDMTHSHVLNQLRKGQTGSSLFGNTQPVPKQQFSASYTASSGLGFVDESGIDPQRQRSNSEGGEVHAATQDQQPSESVPNMTTMVESTPAVVVKTLAEWDPFDKEEKDQ